MKVIKTLFWVVLGLLSLGLLASLAGDDDSLGDVGDALLDNAWSDGYDMGLDDASNKNA